MGNSGTCAVHAYSAFNGSSPHSSDDCLGHGTNVGDTIGGLQYGVAKNVTLHAGHHA